TTSQTTSTQNGEPRAFVISAGVRNIPTPMISPTTNAIAVRAPRRLSRGPEASLTRSEAQARAELEGARPARAEHAVRGGDRLAETGRAQVAGALGILAVPHEDVGVAGVVPVRDSQDVGGVPHVETLDHRLEGGLSAELEAPREAQVEGLEAVAEAGVVVDEREQQAVDPSRRVLRGEERVQ